MKCKLTKVDDNHYISADGDTIKREYGKSPNGNDFNGRWVLRDDQGLYIDHDKYFNDLIEKHGFIITAC